MASIDGNVQFVLRYYDGRDKIDDPNTIFPCAGPCYAEGIDKINPFTDGIDKIVIFAKYPMKDFKIDLETCKWVPTVQIKLLGRTLGNAMLPSSLQTMKNLYELLLDAIDKKQFTIECDNPCHELSVTFPHIQIKIKLYPC